MVVAFVFWLGFAAMSGMRVFASEQSPSRGRSSALQSVDWDRHSADDNRFRARWRSAQIQAVTLPKKARTV
jgi:hypothetical protein